jgi:hypothetical protein
VTRAPGTIPGTVNPPRAPWQTQQGPEPVVASAPPQGQAAPQGPGTRVASAAPAQQQQSEGFFASLGRKIGIGGATADTTASAPPPAASAKPKAEAKPLPKAFKPVETRQAAASRPPLKPSVDAPAAPAPAAAAPPPKDAMVAGSQPIVGANSFDSRFSAVK